MITARPRRLVHREAKREYSRERVRAVATGRFGVDLTVPVIVPVYKVPVGYRFEARRVNLDSGFINETNTLQGAVMGPGNAIQFLRSGQRIDWPFTQCAVISNGCFPGIITWGDEEGPTLTSGEVFEVRILLSASAAFADSTVTITLEGILMEAGSNK